jgi:hypothetical protein
MGQAWMTWLSDGKQDDIDWLLKNNSLVKALQYSYSFLCSSVALDLVDSAITPRHITTRNIFVTSDTNIHQPVNVQGYLNLELRAPSAS